MFIKLPARFVFQNYDIKTLMIFFRNAAKLVEFTLAKKIPRTFVKRNIQNCQGKKNTNGDVLNM
jgi:hypothetical protein